MPVCEMRTWEVLAISASGWTDTRRVHASLASEAIALARDERGWVADAVVAREVDAYRDDAFPERDCDHCGNPYRGPAVYCSKACAVAD
jgi:hypothetical protein